MRKTTSFSLAFLAALALCGGCGQSASDASKSSSSGVSNVSSQAASPAKDQKICFQCLGQGFVVCRAGCVAGKQECPGPCMRLTRGAWIHMNVAGHDPSELWQKFPNAGGKGGYQAWTQHHVGEVVVYQNGQAVNIGACRVCGGTTRVNCAVCKGEGNVPCELCKGGKFISISWTLTDNPWLNAQPDLIRLKDGTVMLGKVAGSSDEQRTIRTREGKYVKVNASDILPKQTTNSTRSIVSP